jgi:hypothetical protein
LAARSHSGLGEELLQTGFDGALGNLQAISNLLVGQAFKDKGKHSLLTLGEASAVLGRALGLLAFDGPAQQVLFEQGFSLHGGADSLNQ